MIWLQMSTVFWLGDIRQTDIHTTAPLVPAMPTENLNYKSPGIAQISAKLIKAGGRTFCYEIHEFINSVWNKEDMLAEWKESVTYL